MWGNDHPGVESLCPFTNMHCSSPRCGTPEPIYYWLPWVPLVPPKIGIIWSLSQNYYQLPEVPQVHPKIGIIWSFSQNYHQLPEVPLVQPRIGITWPCSQIYYQLLAKFNLVRYRQLTPYSLETHLTLT